MADTYIYTNAVFNCTNTQSFTYTIYYSQLHIYGKGMYKELSCEQKVVWPHKGRWSSRDDKADALKSARFYSKSIKVCIKVLTVKISKEIKITP